MNYREIVIDFCTRRLCHGAGGKYNEEKYAAFFDGVDAMTRIFCPGHYIPGAPRYGIDLCKDRCKECWSQECTDPNSVFFGVSSEE